LRSLKTMVRSGSIGMLPRGGLIRNFGQAKPVREHDVARFNPGNDRGLSQLHGQCRLSPIEHFCTHREETTVRTFDVQGIEIRASRPVVFDFVRDPHNLPKWAHAFQQADDKRANLKTPTGTVDIDLRTFSREDAGTIDWELKFPDGAIGFAQSRVTETARGTCIYSFVLHGPPVPLEQLEGALDAQRMTLREELAELKRLLEGQ